MNLNPVWLVTVQKRDINGRTQRLYTMHKEMRVLEDLAKELPESESMIVTPCIDEIFDRIGYELLRD